MSIEPRLRPATANASALAAGRQPGPACRFCRRPLPDAVLDLGMSPLCERFLRADQLDEMEPFYPLRLYVCEACHLVQLSEYVTPEEIFTEYAYFSSFSVSWVDHAHRYAEAMIDRLGLGEDNLVVELGSNDGYLLRHFVDRRVPVLGIEPAANVAEAAERNGVRTLNRFFGRGLASELVHDGRQADLIVGNNVLAQVPDVNDFVAGIQDLLAPTGTVTIEVPHLLRLLEGRQFDTIYHEHFSYFSLASAARIFAAHGLAIVDVDELSTHGGSLRLHFQHDRGATGSDRVAAVLADERTAGLETPEPYRRFAEEVRETKRRLLEFLTAEKRAGRTIAGYGAPGKANTLLNYCGIMTDFVDYTVDRNPYKHGRFLPGTHIPIHSPDRLAETRPDDIWILPWNLADEIRGQLEYAREWGARFVVAIPDVRVLE
jgi:SAM-dependent methyltransferase